MFSKKNLLAMLSGASVTAALLCVTPSFTTLAFTKVRSSLPADWNRQLNSASLANPLSGLFERFADNSYLRTSFYEGLSAFTHLAATHQSGLARITSDQNSDVSVLSFIIDANAVVQGVSFATISDGSTTTLNFSLADIESAAGVILLKQQGHNIFYLNGAVDSAAGTGSVTIRYLANGLWGTYQSCPANVGRTADGEWHLYNASTGQEVTSAKVETWSMGVTTIHGICPESASLVPPEVSQEQ